MPNKEVLREAINNTDTEIESVLRSGIETLKARREKHGNKYGEVYKQFGDALLAHFPNGIHIEADDYDKATKLGVIVQILTKTTRYCAALDDGGHKDSAHDCMNYSAMLESLTKG